jgi:DnaJ-class molecular chaperone
MSTSETASPIIGPTRTCPDCEGRAYEASSGLPCLGCRGRGVLAE